MGGERIERLEVRVFSVPTDAPESDGTGRWDQTTMVPVLAHGAGRVGLGDTYAGRAAGELIHHTLFRCAVGADVQSPSAVFQSMGRMLGNLGRRGPGWMAAGRGALVPSSEPGNGLVLKQRDVARFELGASG